MTQLYVSHTTTYTFENPPAFGLQQLRLTPKSRSGHHVANWNIEIQGGQIETEYPDYNNNHTHLVSFLSDANRMIVKCEGMVEISISNGIWGRHGAPAPLWYYKRNTVLTNPGSEVKSMLKDCGFDPSNSLASLHLLSAYILDKVSYEIGQTHPDTSTEEAIALGKGVCQDHAHIFITCARQLGFPARYVSGYLMMLDRVEQNASHAWAEVWVDDLGWVGFDVSNQISPNSQYVRVASGLDYKEAAPISGLTFGGTGEKVDVQLHVQQQ